MRKKENVESKEMNVFQQHKKKDEKSCQKVLTRRRVCGIIPVSYTHLAVMEISKI